MHQLHSCKALQKYSFFRYVQRLNESVQKKTTHTIKLKQVCVNYSLFGILVKLLNQVNTIHTCSNVIAPLICRTIFIWSSSMCKMCEHEITYLLHNCC